MSGGLYRVTLPARCNDCNTRVRGSRGVKAGDEAGDCASRLGLPARCLFCRHRLHHEVHLNRHASSSPDKTMSPGMSAEHCSPDHDTRLPAYLSRHMRLGFDSDDVAALINSIDSSQDPQSSELSHLPAEILFQIVEFVPVNHILTWRLVCRGFRDAIDGPVQYGHLRRAELIGYVGPHAQYPLSQLRYVPALERRWPSSVDCTLCTTVSPATRRSSLFEHISTEPTVRTLSRHMHPQSGAMIKPSSP